MEAALSTQQFPAALDYPNKVATAASGYKNCMFYMIRFLICNQKYYFLGKETISVIIVRDLANILFRFHPFSTNRISQSSLACEIIKKCITVFRAFIALSNSTHSAIKY